jgi:hypothetical protein
MERTSEKNSFVECGFSAHIILICAVPPANCLKKAFLLQLLREYMYMPTVLLMNQCVRKEENLNCITL